MSTKLTTKTIVALASMMLACFVSVAAENPYTVQYTVNGYTGTEELANFPVLVRLAAGSPVGFSYSDCAAGGADLTFTDDAGNVIPREVDTWNTEGESLVWVCVPVVTNGTTFTMHYGDTAVAAHPACQTNGTVWSGANYKGVWHMDSVDPADSSPNGYDGRHQTSALSVVDGALGAAVNFPRTTTGDGITCGEVLANSELADGFTIEGWCRPTQYGEVGDGAAMFGKKDIVSLRIKTDTMVVLTTPTVANHEMSLASGVLPAVNTWWHFVATFKMNTSNDGLKFYVNGQLVKKQGAGNIKDQTTATEMFIGNNQWDQAFKGDLDEIRLSAGIRSTNWVAASYATQHAADFLSAGPRTCDAAPFLAHTTAAPSYTSAQLSVLLASVGDGATSATVTLAYGPEGGQLSEPVVLAPAATNEQMLTTNLTGLTVGTTYRYVFTAENNLSTPQSRTAEGTFSTLNFSAPTLSFSDSQEGPNSQTVGTTVTELGGASTCDLYFAYGPEGSPLAYTQVGTDLAAGATFSRLLGGLEFGTVYAYSFAVTNDLGLGTVETGTFTAGVGCLNPAHFTYRAKFTVTGYAGTEVLTNFPVLVRLSANSPLVFNYADCAEGGSDIRFSDAGGRPIPHEIDTWNTAGESLVWVGLPTVTNGTSFTMHYCAADVSALLAVTAADVWTNANFNAVWHFSGDSKESANGLTVSDSAGTPDYTATTFGLGSAFQASGDATIGYNVDAKWTTLGVGNTLTVSTWAKYDSSTPGYARMLSCMSNWGNPTGWELTIQDAVDKITVGSSGQSQYQYTATGVGPGSGNVYLTAVYNADKTVQLYVNGGLAKSAALNQVVTPTEKLWIASCNKSGNKWDGKLDEIRIHRDAESADWVKACYDTMSSGAFLTAGPSSALGLSASTQVVGFDAVNVIATVDSAGEDVALCDLYFAYAPAGDALPDWILVASGLSTSASHTYNLTDLIQNADYHYALMASNNLGKTIVRTGTFTAGAGYLDSAHFAYRENFTVTGYTNSTEVLENFPVLVRLVANSTLAFDYADCALGGSDIRFADANGKLIPHEIETWDTAGESLIWVGLPIATNGTTFAMYYHSDAPGLPSTDDVWTDYVAVVHGGASITNSVAGGPAATAGSAAVTASSNAGKIGGGVNKSSNNSIGLNIADVASKLDNIGKYSVSAWFKRNGNGGNNNNGTHILAATRAAWGSGTGFVWLQEQGKYIAISAPNAHQFSTGNHTLPNGAWAHAAFSYESGVALTTYFNGALDNQKTSDLGNLVNTSGPWTFGSYANTGSKDSFLGDMDELRIYNGVASSNRIRAEYDTMTNDSFLAVSPRVVLAPFFSNATATPAYTNAQLSVLLVTVGDGATSATVTLAYGPEGGELSAPIVLAAAATDGQTLSTNLTGLADGTTYHYLVQVVNDLDSPRTNTIEGVFTTLGYSAPELSLSTASEGMDSQSVSACIVNLGGADTCNLYFSYGPASDPLPPYTQVGTDMAAGATFSRLLTGLQAGIAYTYSFAATNNLDLGTIVTSSFTPGVGFPRPDVNIAEFSRGVKFTVTGYTGTQELTNFPVLVRLANNSPAGFSYADFYNPGDVPGSDLCFLDAAGNGIPHEIDTWNTSGESLVWVTIPRMTNGVEFSMWYRSSKNGSVVCHANAWEDYTGVWHLGEGGDGVQTVADSTVNALDGVTHANSSAQSAGRIGGSRRVSTKGGASDANGRILVSLSDANKRAAVDALAATGSDKTFTASAWMCPRGGTDYCYLIGRKTDDKYGAWGAQFNVNSSGWYNSMRVYSAGTADSQSASVGVDATANGVWRKIDIVWTKTDYTVYYDGGAKKWTGALNSANGQEPVNGSSDLAFGGTTSSGYGSMNGELDEVRLRVGNMGDDWVKADYDTVNNTAFLNGGTVVSLAETPRPIATLALSDSSAKYVQFSGSIGNCGGEATECAAYCKVWKTAEDEPSTWTLLVSGLGAGDVFTKAVTGLDPETAYSYKIKAVNNLETPVDSEIEEGTFTTGGTGSGGAGGERYRVGNDYVHVFEIEPGTDITAFEFTPPEYVSSIQALVVAGGGPGGYRRGGGGGAGGLIYDAALAVTGGETYAINVGTGGVASASQSAYGSNGGNSSIVGTGVSVTAVGGGAGGNGPSNGAGKLGGSGGGAGSGSTTAGAGTADQGNAGGIRGVNGNNSTGGGGGGAGRPGSDGSLDSPPSGGSGGQGFLTDISGTSTWYAGGGGGGGVQAGTASNSGSPGGGGDGGGGRGGMAIPSGMANPSFGPAAVAGQNGLGGGGGGGSDVDGFYEGGNGGNGIVIVRYTVQGSGAGSAEPVVSLTGATYAGDLKITGTYRVAWAGEGANDADVYIKWGYAANSLTHSVLVAPDAIGTGSFEITVPVDQTTIYLRAMADNGTAQGLSDEIVPIYVPEYSGVVPGDPTIPVFGTVFVSAVDGIFARLSGTVTSFGTAEQGEDPITGCEVYALIGTSENVSRMTAQDAMPVTANEQFSLAISNLTADVTYYWCLEARNSAGVAVATQVGSFTTLPEHTIASAITANNVQRTVNLSGSLATVGAGTTTVSVRWKEGSDDWGDWTTVATFDGSSASTAFNTSHTSESWSTTISWEVSFSNQCVTAGGEPVGDPWVTTQNGSYSPSDTATYTWQAVAGDWDGSWTNAAHWACTQADRRDYPDGSGVTVAFNNNTVATIEVPGDYTFGSWSIAKSGIDVTLVGEGAATSALRGNMAGGAVANSSWTFSALTFAESNGLDFGNTSVANNTITFTDGAVGSTGSGYLNLVGSNVWLVVEKGASFQRAIHNCTKDGGVRLDDGTISGNAFRTDYNWTATTNEWFIFKGAAPRLTATESFRNESTAEAYLQNSDSTFLFSVPRNGWAAAPLYAEYNTSEKFGGMLGTGEGGYVIAIDPESPAFTAAGTHAVQLVEWRSGIDTAHVRFADNLPEAATLSWTYGWPSTLAAPENEGDAPTGVKVTIVGRAKRSMILVW